MEESVEREFLLAERKSNSVLKELGKLLQHNVRGSDIACRYGGEEFLIIMPDTSVSISRQRAEYLREAVEHLSIQRGRQSYENVTISLGVAIFPEHGSTADAVIRVADMALYRDLRGSE